MNWARNNRFLAGFLVVMLLGVGGLGFLLYSALGRYSSVDEQYKTQVTELKRLQALQPYPDQTNQTKYEELRKNYSVAVRDLQTDLARYEPAPENPPPTPLQFQDRLRKAVEDTTSAAQRASIDISTKDKFYLGFEQYSGTPPEAAATPLLSYELTAIDDLMTIMLQNKIDTLGYIKRGLLPGEAGATATPTPAGPGRPAAAAPTPLVVKYPVEIAFSATPNAFRQIIDAITTSKRLFIVRAVQVKNQVPVGPLRAVAETPGATPTAASPAVDSTNPNNSQPLPDKGPPTLRYVVGQEKLDVVLRIELTKIAPPAAAAPAR